MRRHLPIAVRLLLVPMTALVPAVSGSAQDELDQATRRAQALLMQQQQGAQQLATDETALASLLPVIRRSTLFPAETVLAVPGAPEQAVRGLLVLRGMTRRLETRMLALADEQARLTQAEADLAKTIERLRKEEESRRVQAASLDTHSLRTEEASRPTPQIAAEARRSSGTAAAPTGPLRGAVGVLGSAAPPTSAPTLGSARAGAWASPVAGSVVRSFGAAGDAGPAQGVTIATPSRARVVAPCGGSVAFSRPFRSYGLMVILDCGTGTHVVMAGFDRVTVRPGQVVQTGQPVGVMPAHDPLDPPTARTRLYIEIHRPGGPIDPGPLLRATPQH